MGFGKKGKNSFTIHRSEEVLPGEMRGALSRGSSASSDGEGSADGDRFAYAKHNFFYFFDFLEKFLFMFLICELLNCFFFILFPLNFHHQISSSFKFMDCIKS